MRRVEIGVRGEEYLRNRRARTTPDHEQRRHSDYLPARDVTLVVLCELEPDREDVQHHGLYDVEGHIFASAKLVRPKPT